MKKSKVIDKHVPARRADSRDAEVGRRVRSRRLECRLSQTDLADRIGVTFQQVQKYEKGVNRIGAGRLQRISEALEVPITFFFDVTPHAPERGAGSSSESAFGFMQTSGAVRIVKAFHRIESRKAGSSRASRPPTSSLRTPTATTASDGFPNAAGARNRGILPSATGTTSEAGARSPAPSAARARNLAIRVGAATSTIVVSNRTGN